MWALTARGARSVMGSLWPVADEAARFMAEGFYARLAEGLSLSKALQAMMQEMRRTERFTNPYYWAPFVLYGEAELSIL